MSITFWAPQAATVRVQPYPDEPEYFENRSVLPEINLSNSNAWAMLEAMGIKPDHCGELASAELDAVITRLTRLVNDASARAPALQASSVTQGARRLSVQGNVVRVAQGPTVYHGGRDDDYVARRAAQLLELFVAARREGFGVCWG